MTRSSGSLAWALIAQVVIRILGMVAGLATVAVQGRSLGIEDFATLSMLLAIALGGQTLVDLGLGKVATQRVAANPSAAASIAGAVLVARFVLGVVVAIGGAALGGSIAGGGDAFVAALLVCLSLPLSAVTVLQALSEARLHVWSVNAIVVAQNVVWLVVVLALYVADAGLLWFAAGYAVAAVVQAGVVWVISVRSLRIRVRGAVAHAVPLVRSAIPLGMGALAVTAYYRLTGVILFQQTDADSAAGYFAAMRLIDAGQVLPATIGGVLLPLLSRALHDGDGEAAARSWDVAVRVQLAASIPLAVVVGVHAGDVLDLLYGRQFSPRSGQLVVLMFAYVPICLGWIVTSALIAAGELRIYSLVVIGIACASLSALVAGVGRFEADWAAGVTVGTEWLCVSILLLVVWRRVGLAVGGDVFARASVLALALGAACFAARGLGLVAGLVIAAVLGSIVALGVQLVTTSMLRDGFARRATSRVGVGVSDR